MEEIKVFAMNDCDWMAAATLEEAVKGYLEWLGGGHVDEDMIEDAHELTAEAMERIQYTDDEADPPVKRSFREQLNKLIADGEKFPCFFASTEY